jgi:hypothetical protein
LAVTGGYLLCGPVRAETYLSVDEARTLIWPGLQFMPVDVVLTSDQQKAIKRASGVRVRVPRLSAWRATTGDWFLVDQVIGKHEYIDIAIGISQAGAIAGIEILTYRESYGDEVRHPKWRAQFRGRTTAAPLRLDDPIQNISGATLSCSHITDAANRLLQTWQLVLRSV